MSKTASAGARILLVEDTPALARTYQAFLKDEPYQITHVESGEAALTAAAKEAPDLIMMDVRLPGMSGIEALRKLRDQGAEAPAIVLTAHGSVAVAVEAMQAGASDFLLKPFNAERLKVTLANMLKTGKLSAQIKAYEKAQPKGEFHGIIGQSLPMQAVYRSLESAAASKATVFIVGESGVGKELCAEATHRLSNRRKKPFIPINCAAIPRDLMESEVFGHVKGAFTGAIADREGAAAAADGGTLFLDEICEMDPYLQAKLLRFLQSGTFTRLGTERPHKVDVRIVCATNRDPWAEVEAGRFREDLLYRLYVLPIEVPALRERGQDVIRIAEALLERLAEEEGKDVTRFSDDARSLLQTYPWPGNIRELQNAVRQAVVMNTGAEITAAMLPARIRESTGRIMPVQPVIAHQASAATSMAPPPAAPVETVQQEAYVSYASSGELPVEGDIEAPELAETEASTDIKPLADVERDAIEHAIAICGGDITNAARRLGIARATIYRKLKEWRRAARTPNPDIGLDDGEGDDVDTLATQV